MIREMGGGESILGEGEEGGRYEIGRGEEERRWRRLVDVGGGL